MNRSAPLCSQTGVLGCVCVGLTLWVTAVAAQQPPAEAPAGDGAAANDTEILANQGATFSAKDRVAVFSGSVVVRDPRFNLKCDKLTVYLAKGAIPDGSAPSTPAATATPAPIKSADTGTKDANRGGGIDHAIAEGHVVIVQKRAPTKAGEEEKTSVGQAETVEFDNNTGNLTLRGLPKVEQNGNSHEALTRATYMILHRDNSLDTIGPSKTHIVQRAKDGDLPGAKPAGTKSGSTTPANRRAPVKVTQG